MARKVINVKAPTELELQFENGKSLLVVFDTEAYSNFNDLEGGLMGLASDKSMSEQCAKILYAGAKLWNEGFTFEDARTLVSGMEPCTIIEIINEFNESAGMVKNGVQSELQKKLMEQFLQTYMK